jgi:hypothetical protein
MTSRDDWTEEQWADWIVANVKAQDVCPGFSHVGTEVCWFRSQRQLQDKDMCLFHQVHVAYDHWEGKLKAARTERERVVFSYWGLFKTMMSAYSARPYDTNNVYAEVYARMDKWVGVIPGLPDPAKVHRDCLADDLYHETHRD